jgi:sodium-dependent dicarboxylate transporter 2/3/5
MIASAITSMWVSNTATTMMMLPIGISVISLSRDQNKNISSEYKNFSLCLMLGIAYGASVGGLATLIGTPPNALWAGFMLENYQYQIGFAQWMSMALPLVIVGLVLTFYVLTRLVYPVRMEFLKGGKIFIRKELEKMGAMSRPEKMVAVVFCLVAFLWILRPLFSNWIQGLSDTGIAILGAVLMFVLPVDFSRDRFILNWREAENLPWGVLLLFGGGLSLASAINTTGLAAWIANQLVFIQSWPLVLVILLITSIVILLTELTSNTATAATFLPIMASLAVGIGQHPLLLTIPTVLGASCAFMLPVATPPNAIIYSSGAVSITQMSRAGIVLNVLFALLITLLCTVLIQIMPGFFSAV